MLVSLIISTYNWPEALGLCLKSILLQTVNPSEIIIADDGSSESTKNKIEEFRKQLSVPVKHIWHEDDGFRKAIILNKAIKAAEGEYILQIDGDVVLNKKFINDHVAVAEKNTFVRGSRAHLTPIGTKLAIDKGTVDFAFFDKHITHRFNAIRSGLFLPFFVKKSASSISVRGSNLAFWKQDCLDVNGYNNSFNGWGHEDEEFAARLVNKGVLKKKIKLTAIQYHLYHSARPDDMAKVHEAGINQVRKNKIACCNNGIKQV